MRISDWSSDVCSSDLPGGSPPARFLSDSIIISTSDLVRRIDREGFCLSGVMLWVLPVTVLTNGRAEKVHPAIVVLLSYGTLNVDLFAAHWVGCRHPSLECPLQFVIGKQFLRF